MKNIMTILIMGILLVGTISAFTITNGNDWSDVAWEGESFKLKGTETYCNIIYNGNISDCDYEIWANKEAQDTIDSLTLTPIRETNVTIGEEVISQEDYNGDTSWIVGMIKKLVEKFENIFSRTNYLEDELCKKDSSYGFCKGIGEVTP